jgi:cytochrome oxidase Cu insertion factor (SCO1/SenC/PrrC family)
MMRRSCFQSLLVTGWLVLAGLAAAHEGPHAQRALPAGDFSVIEKKSRDNFSDAPLVDQHGKPVRFYSDALKGSTVLINVIYTECKDACPLITRSLVEVRKALGSDAPKTIRFVSISVDPERDTPEALRKFAQQNEAEHPAWIFLTGRKSVVDGVTRKLGQYASEPEMHTSLLIAGNVDRGNWIKIRPDTKPELIAARLRDLARP